jgi:hypothetical protein
VYPGMNGGWMMKCPGHWAVQAEAETQQHWMHRCL